MAWSSMTMALSTIQRVLPPLFEYLSDHGPSIGAHAPAIFVARPQISGLVQAMPGVSARKRKSLKWIPTILTHVSWGVQ